MKLRIISLIVSVLCLNSFNGAHADTIASSITDSKAISFESKSSSGARLGGNIAEGWKDNSEWAKVSADYNVIKNGNESFMQVKASQIDSGYCQFYYKLSDSASAANAVLSFKSRIQGRSRVTCGLRLIDAPYTWISKNSFTPESEWENKSFRFSFPKQKQAVAIFFAMDGAGTFDLKDVRLETAALKEESREGNLLRSSVFPLGLPAGWSLHNSFSDGDDVKLSQNGSSLIIDAPEGAMTSYDYLDKLRIYSAPMKSPALKEKHIAEMRFKGNADGTLIILCGSRSVAEKSFKAEGASSSILQIEFTPVEEGVYTCRLDLKGRLELEKLSVASAKEMPLSTEPEIALRLEDSETAASGIVFKDEKLTMKYSVLNAPTGSQVRLRSINIYGSEKTYEIPLKQESGSINIELKKDQELGPLRIEADIINSDGKQVGSPAERVVNILKRPVYWHKDAPDSAFGTHVQPVTRNIIMAKAIGVNWIRLHDAGVQLLGWAYTEREPGKWTFNDAAIEKLRKQKLKLLGELTTAPLWESYATKSKDAPPILKNSITAPYFLPLSLEKYEAYCKKIVDRYGDKIDHFDVWNEPWLPLFFHTDFVKKLPPDTKRWASFGGGFYISPDDPAAEFFKMQKIVWKTVKAKYPSSKVLGFNTTDSEGTEGRVPGDKFTARMNELGAVDHCDVICYHQYLTKITGFPGDEVEKGFKFAFKDLLEKNSGKMPRPVWLSEGSPLIAPCDGFYKKTLPGGSRNEIYDSGDRIVRFVTSLRANGVEKTFLYSMGMHNGFGTKNPHRIMIDAAGDLHPSGAAYSNMCSLLEDKKFSRMIKCDKNIYAYIFTGKTESVAVMLPDPRETKNSFEITNDVRYKAWDIFGNPLASGAIKTPYVFYLTWNGGAEKFPADKGGNRQ